ncbi:hypothetical protein Q5P01_002268 [Channa striata]|uniref:Uncharacterized protein n=1 Tax=Channa striata TaxID=64152 RepID=A0AA88NNW6_CHASR|nr:hypothetical protein Q5P01_002268 [Channa striata]
MDGLIVGKEKQVRRKRCQGDQLAREDTAARVTRRVRACVRACAGTETTQQRRRRRQQLWNQANGGASGVCPPSQRQPTAAP